jgi:hypothetical protein
MSQQFVQEPDPECAAVVKALCERYGWALIERAAFAERVAAHAATGGFRTIGMAALNLYSITLHQACSGAEGRERQERAYTELGWLLMQAASSHHGLRDQALVDEVLGEIFEQFPTCRVPGAFIAFAQQRLRNAVKRTRNTRFVSLEARAVELSEEGDDDLHALISAELRESVAFCREQFLRRYPGARLQFAAVWMKFVLELDDATIGVRLAKSPQQVYVLRCRGLKKLRAEPAWQALADEWELRKL